MKCLECGKDFKYISNHIKKHNITLKEYYDKYLKKENENICKRLNCKNETKFRNLDEGYAKFCSIKCSAQSEQTKLKRENSMTEKYGASNPSLCKEIVLKRTKKLRLRTDEEKKITEEKKKNTYKKKYNTEHPMKCKNVLEKVQQTNLKKYGNICSLQCEEIQDKVKSTNLKKYNTTHPMKNLQVKTKLSNTITTKRSPLIKRILNEVYNLELLNDFENNYKNLLLKCNICGNIFEKNYFNIYQGPSPCNICNPIKSGKSKQEIEIYDFLKLFSLEIKLNYREIIFNEDNNRKLEIDIYIPEKNTAIEYNGLYWHGEKRISNKFLHLYKTNLCNEKNIRLIHIFEDEWIFKKEIVKSRLKQILNLNNNEKIYARKCIVKEIDAPTKNEFLEQFHLQGKDNSSIKLGAFYNDELVSVMTFSKGNVSKGSKVNDEVWELNRFCSDYNYNVIGIAGKLLAYFKLNYKWKEIFSYADRRWSNGNLYYKLGFQLEHITKPNYWYIKNYQRIHRFNLRKKPDEPKELTEWELRQLQDYDRIWDCGSLKFSIKK